MSTNYNRRRGAKATKPRNVRTCCAVVDYKFPAPGGGFEPTTRICNAAVPPNVNGNRCEEHAK